MPGARCTRGLVCEVRIENAHEHTGTADTPAFPAQWFYGLYVLSPATNSSCHRHRRISGSFETRLGEKASAD